MKKILVLAVMVVLFAGCRQPGETRITTSRGLMFYESSGAFKGTPKFTVSCWIPKAEINPFNEKRTLYTFGLDNIVIGPKKRTIWKSTTSRPEGYALATSYVPASSVIVFEYTTGKSGFPGYRYNFLAIQLPDLELGKPERPGGSPYPRIFEFGMEKESPRAAVFIESIPSDDNFKPRPMPAHDKPERFDDKGDPFRYCYRFYSEKVYSGRVVLESNSGGVITGVLELTFPENMINRLGFSNQGADFPEYRDFTVRGRFNAKKYIPPAPEEKE